MSRAASRRAPRSGLCVDAVGVSRDAEGVVAHHSVYGGAYNVDAAVTWGAPVITVRQGAIEARAEAVARRRGRDARRCRRRARRPRPSTRSRPSMRDLDRGPSCAARRKVVSGGRGLGSAGEVRARRAARRRARRRGRRIARRGRRRLRAAVAPGRADRRLGVAAAVRRARHLGRDPAHGRHADRQDDRRDQQGRRRPDLRDRRLRRRRRPVHRRAAADQRARGERKA